MKTAYLELVNELEARGIMESDSVIYSRISEFYFNDECTDVDSVVTAVLDKYYN